MSHTDSPQPNHTRTGSATITLASVLLILVITLYPFSFLSIRSINHLFHYFNTSTSLLHYFNTSLSINGLLEPVANVLLFIPLGFSLTALIAQRQAKRVAALLWGQALCSSLSLAIEVLQVFEPERHPAFMDLLTNSAGALLGGLLFLLWQAHGKPFRVRISPEVWSLSLTAYAVVLVLLSIYAATVPRSWDLSNWDTSFPLVIGNEATGNRPWHGRVSGLFIADRAFSEAEVAAVLSGNVSSQQAGLLVSYLLDGEANYADQTGNLPRLSWQPSSGVYERDGSLGHHWLQTETSAAFASQRIRKTSQFTLGATVTPANITQEGPARIISISKNPDDRNVTLGQERADLILRIRTPFNGANGNKVEFILPNGLIATAPHRILVTYSKSMLKLYVDDVRRVYTVELTPEVKAVWFFARLGQHHVYLSKATATNYILLYYGFVFMPLGFILARVIRTHAATLTIKLGLMIAAMVLPSLLLQLIFTLGGSYAVHLDSLLLGMLMTGGGVAGTFLKQQRRTSNNLIHAAP